MGLNTDGGPIGILRPGRIETRTFFSFSGPEEGTYSASVNNVYRDVDAAFDWESIRARRKFIGMSDEEFQPIFDQLIAQVGTTNGDFLRMLGRNAALLPDVSGDNRDVSPLVDLELTKARAVLDSSIAGTVQDPSSAVGLEMVAFNTTTGRAFATTVLNDGSFLFDSVTAGIYELRVRGYSVVIASNPSLDIAEGASIDGLSIELIAGLDLSIAVTDAVSGNEIQDATVIAFGSDGGVYASDTLDGYVITGLPADDYTVSIERTGYARTFVTTTIASDDVSLAASLTAEATVQAQIRINGELPTEGILAIATREGSDVHPDYAPTTTEGSVDFRGLPAGTYEILVMSRNFFGSTTFTLAAGQDLDLGTIELIEEPASELTALVDVQAELTRIERDIRRVVVNYERLVFDESVAELMEMFLDASPTNPAAKQHYQEGSPIGDSFKNHPKTKQFFDEVFIAAVAELKKKLDGERSCHDPDAETTVNIRQLVTEDKLSKNIEYGAGAEGINTIPGHIAGGVGGTHGINRMDSRTIYGELVVSVSKDKMTVGSNLRMVIEESFDFVDGGDGADHGESTPEFLKRILPSERDVVNWLRLLEYWGHAGAVPFAVYVGDARADKVVDIVTVDSETGEPEECKDDDDDPTERPGSFDPNDILGPRGFGQQRWVAASEPLDYTIRFENDPVFATAPAQVVSVTQQLDADLDYRSFRVGDFAIGNVFVDVPENRSFYSDRIDLTDQLGVLVDVVAGIDVQSGEAFWTFTSLDPETGDVPDNPLLGFLAPNLNSPEGEGFVKYSIARSRRSKVAM